VFQEDLLHCKTGATRDEPRATDTASVHQRFASGFQFWMSVIGTLRNRHRSLRDPSMSVVPSTSSIRVAGAALEPIDVAPARPRIIDLRDYSSSRPTYQVHADLQPCRGGNSTLMSEAH